MLIAYIKIIIFFIILFLFPFFNKRTFYYCFLTKYALIQSQIYKCSRTESKHSLKVFNLITNDNMFDDVLEHSQAIIQELII